MILHESWAKRAVEEGNKNWNKIAYMEGADAFQKRVIEEMKKELDKYDHSRGEYDRAGIQILSIIIDRIKTLEANA